MDDEADFVFEGFREDSMPTIERFYPHLATASKIPYKTKKAAIAAAKEVARKEREGLK